MAHPSAADPFRIDGPALISFSGGRTSGFMLAKILEAHGGELPADAHVLFANTGKEREETLRFVHEVATRWSVKVRWLEWRRGAIEWAEVGPNSAARAGEPFEDLIDWKMALPNWQARWCTGFLKVRPMVAYMESIGHAPGTYTEMIGLRDDERGRIGDMMERNVRDSRQCTAPLGRAGVVKADVMAFWRAQPFDLELRDGEGNCDLCFLKGRRLKKAIISARPTVAGWWISQERARDATFDRRDSVEKLAREVYRAPTLFSSVQAEDFDVECGLACG